MTPENPNRRLLARARRDGRLPQDQARAEREALNLAERFAAIVEDAERFAAIVALRRHLDQAERQAVAAMRQLGCTWQQVAEATNMNSRQAAHWKFGLFAPSRPAKRCICGALTIPDGGRCYDCEEQAAFDNWVFENEDLRRRPER